MHFKMIIGLGNPGKDYERTYHNAGALFVAYLAEHYPEATQGQEELFSFTRTPDLILVRSGTFMNLSGAAVQKALRYFNIPLSQMLLVHDDSDLPLGKFRLDPDSGHAGHAGVQSVMDALGTKEFWRLRLGIRKETPIRAKAGDFVLKKMDAAAYKTLTQSFGTAAESIRKVI